MTMSKGSLRAWAVAAVLVSQGAAMAADLTLPVTASGDASYGWNSKYGPYGYTQGGTDLGVSLQMGGRWGNDYSVGLIEVPIAALRGSGLVSALLQVQTTGFGTGYYYGSAGLAWLDVGAQAVTGDVVADGLGALAAPSITWTLWNSDGSAGSGDPATKTVDVTSVVLLDLAAGRDYSSFQLTGSRDTWGGIYAAESGQGSRLLATTTAPVPEPASWMALLGGLAALGLRSHRRRQAAAG